MKRLHGFVSVVVMMSAVLVLLAGCSSSGGGDDATPTPTPTPTPSASMSLSGTAAVGAPIASATITLKDATGTLKSVVTGTDGKYTFDTTGMTAPFLLKVPSGTSSLYSVATTTGVANVHPFTDLIIQTWYKVQGKTAETAFNDPVGNPAPDATVVQMIAKVIMEVIQKWLVDGGIDPATFDLITTPFNANSAGFDAILDKSTVAANGTVTITDGTVTQTSVITCDPTTGSTTVDTLTTSPTGSSSSVSTTVIAATPALQVALAGVNSTVTQLVGVINSKGAALAKTDLIGFFDSAYLNDGENADIGAARMAGWERGNTSNSFVVEKILSYNDTTKVLAIDEGSYFKQQANGTWLFYGNQRLAYVGLQVEMRTDIWANAQVIGPRMHINVHVSAPLGSISTVMISGGGVFNSTDIPNSLVTNVETIDDTPTTHITLNEDQFWIGADADTAPGTVFTVTVTPVSGSPVSYAVKSNGTTHEPISITNLSGHTLADAKLGQPSTVNWKLPTTFPVKELKLNGYVLTAPPGSPGLECWVEVIVTATATSGVITLPSTCSGQPTVAAGINVSANGLNGERNMIIYQFE